MERPFVPVVNVPGADDSLFRNRSIVIHLMFSQVPFSP